MKKKIGTVTAAKERRSKRFENNSRMIQQGREPSIGFEDEKQGLRHLEKF
jgi:hypothetical protein